MLYMLPVSHWAPVPNTENKYWVNQLGEVLSLHLRSKSKIPKKLRPRISHGYHRVDLVCGSSITSHQVHRLVYRAFVRDIGPDVYIDHIDRNKANNTLINLRECTPAESARNRAAPTRSVRNGSYGSKYKGVWWLVDREQWVSKITLNGKVHYLGQFQDEDEAARAYNEAAKKFYGEFALLNEI